MTVAELLNELTERDGRDRAQHTDASGLIVTTWAEGEIYSPRYYYAVADGGDVPAYGWTRSTAERDVAIEHAVVDARTFLARRRAS